MLTLVHPGGHFSEPLCDNLLLAKFLDFQRRHREFSGGCGVNYPTKDCCAEQQRARENLRHEHDTIDKWSKEAGSGRRKFNEYDVYGGSFARYVTEEVEDTTQSYVVPGPCMTECNMRSRKARRSTAR